MRCAVVVVAVDVAIAVAVAGAGAEAFAGAVAGVRAEAVHLARLSGVVFDDAELCTFDDLGMHESLEELFLVRVTVVTALQVFDIVARGVDCIASGCAFLDVMEWPEVVLSIGGDDDVGGDDSDDGVDHDDNDAGDDAVGDDEDGRTDDEGGGDDSNGGEGEHAP